MVHRQAIFIFGMSRSGTSALARVLSLCGAGLPEQLLAPNEGNPMGYWEPFEAMRINDEFLFDQGSSYYDPSLRVQEGGSLDGAGEAAFIGKIGAFLESLPSARPIVIKEPRIIGLADLWLEAARRASIDVKIVIPVRHPGEVAASLARRDHASFELSNALWLKYNLLAERRSRTVPRVFVEYSRLLADWPTQVSRISEALSVRLDERHDEAIRQFLTHDLYHERAGELREAFGLSWVGEVYEAFVAAARDTRPDTDRLDEIFAAYSACERTFRTAQNEFRNRYPGDLWASDLGPFLARVLDECSAEIARRFGDTTPPNTSTADTSRTAFDSQAARVSGALESLADQGAQLQEVLAKLAVQDGRLHEADVKLAAQDVRLHEADATLAARDIQLHDAAAAIAARDVQLQHAHAELDAQQQASRAREDALTSELARYEAQVATLQRHSTAASAHRDHLALKVARAQATIAQLLSLISTLRAQIVTYERSHSWRMTAALRAIRRGRRAVSPLSSLDVEISAIRLRAERDANQLPDAFDRNAYLTLNPDVAASGVDPEYHYVVFGRQEGRAYSFPSSRRDTARPSQDGPTEIRRP